MRASTAVRLAHLLRPVALGLALLGAAGCRHHHKPVPPSDAGIIPEEFVTESFDELYPVFLLRKIAPGPKARLWTRYYHHWVRWTGKLVSFTPNGCTLKHIPATVTFDVSLYVEPYARARLHTHKIGDTITYIGQLDSYDDIFRTFYIIHGDVVPAEPTDASPSSDGP